MSQNLNLSVSGLYTAPSDFNGLPPGALDVADNEEVRFKNLLEPRRGFEGLPNSAITAAHLKRLINFWIGGDDLLVGLDSDGNLLYYDGSWHAIPGSYSTGINPPDSLNAKSRFIVAGQNLYTTAADGVRSLSSGVSANILRAGVPKGLNLEAATNGDLDGFFSNNVVLATTANLTSASALITYIDDITGIAVGQYVTGAAFPSHKVVQDLTYTSVASGTAANSITIAYTTGGTAGAEVVSVVGSAISIKIQSGVSTATQVRAAFNASAPALALATCAVTGTGGSAQTAPVGPSAFAGGVDNTIPAGTTVLSISTETPLIIQTGNTTAGSATIASVVSITGVVAGVIVSGDGIQEGSRVVSTSGGGPYSVVLDTAAYKTATGAVLTFTDPIVITMSANANTTTTAQPVTFYSGSQVGYRMVFGRVETDVNNGTITRLGAASSIAIATNILADSTNVSVTGTLPKNSTGEITFVQLYRSAQTESISISPLDQYNLVYEAELTAGDFTARTVTIVDDVPDSLKGIPLYSGTDQEGILQSNNPPPMAWDIAKFRDFLVYANITQPSTLHVTIVSVGSPDGIQNGDVLTISGTFAGSPFLQIYNAASSENAASHQFEVFTSGTPSQNIADTAASLIRVVNYDNLVPVHVILLSTTEDLPGQLLFEYDYPSLDTFTVNAVGHQSAYDPTLNSLVSNINTVNNGLLISKSGELEAVPATNLLYAGDSSSDVIRVIPLRDYVVVIKSDGIYKLQGLTPGSLISSPFDLTTKIIGADTAVSLNSAVWMLSNQGVVTISDGGVAAKSVPIDNQINVLVGSFLTNIQNNAFAIGYESDRKYILCVPNSDDTFAETEYNFNYITSAWTTWSRNLYYGFIHSHENKLYISRADPADNSCSRERKTATYKDYVDEATANTITSVSGVTIGLADIDGVEIGDILYQSTTLFSPILAVDLLASTVTIQAALSFTVAACQILHAYECLTTWKQVFGDNPAFLRQFSEGLVLFKNTRFNTATASFVTDFSNALAEVSLMGTGNSLWGLFPWGTVPWGGSVVPSSIRFYIPQDKQLGSLLIPSLSIRQGYSNFGIQGMSISYYNESQELGK